jgi:hypothetical protein
MPAAVGCAEDVGAVAAKEFSFAGEKHDKAFDPFRFSNFQIVQAALGAHDRILRQMPQRTKYCKWLLWSCTKPASAYLTCLAVRPWAILYSVEKDR